MTIMNWTCAPARSSLLVQERGLQLTWEDLTGYLTYASLLVQERGLQYSPYGSPTPSPRSLLVQERGLQLRCRCHIPNCEASLLVQERGLQ